MWGAGDALAIFCVGDARKNPISLGGHPPLVQGHPGDEPGDLKEEDSTQSHRGADTY